MPLTFAHPAAVMPLRSRRLSTAALVVGSMAPDFEYFLRGRPAATISHTAAGLVLFCLPIGLLVFWTSRALFPAYRSLLPGRVKRHVSETIERAPLAALAASVLLGAITHDVWDSFTHRAGWFAQRLQLTRTIGGLPIYRIFQHGSTLLGLIVLGVIAGRFIRSQRTTLRSSSEQSRVAIAYWLMTAIAIAVVLIAGAMQATPVGTVVVRAIDAAIVIAATFALFIVRRSSLRR